MRPCSQVPSHHGGGESANQAEHRGPSEMHTVYWEGHGNPTEPAQSLSVAVRVKKVSLSGSSLGSRKPPEGRLTAKAREHQPLSSRVCGMEMTAPGLGSLGEKPTSQALPTLPRLRSWRHSRADKEKPSRVVKACTGRQAGLSRHCRARS